MKTFFKTLLILASLLFLFKGQAMAIPRSAPLIVDHRAAMEFDQIPDSWINEAKANFRISYDHTSHGSQIITGLDMLASSNAKYNYSSNFLCDHCVFLCDCYIFNAHDLGIPNRTAWAAATRNYLNEPGNDKNMIIWSWCGQHDTTSSNIQIYLDLMNQLENDFPEVTFVYMTGHLNGDGPEGNTRARNDQIRNYCLAHNKILFDFADIERHDPNGVDYPWENDSCGWCSVWCSNHSCPSCDSCAHSHCFNCYQKGKAFWWMMAKLAGWQGDNEPTCQKEKGDADCDGLIKMNDFVLWLSTYRKIINNLPITEEEKLTVDFDNNQQVNLNDFIIWLGNFRQTL